MDLLNAMLVFNPSARIGVNEALAHPYLASLHDESDEPTCPVVFEFPFDMDRSDPHSMAYFRVLLQEGYRFTTTVGLVMKSVTTLAQRLFLGL